jgi:hypothetical protein
MEVRSTLKPRTRAEWRAWLAAHHDSAEEIWLIADDRPEEPTVPYLDAVEEALCFGWIDSIAKRITSVERAQRFSPRRARSNWTELNKARARRLIALGLMTDAGARTLPDLALPFVIAPDILAAIRGEPLAWEHFQTLPDLYVRVRVGYIEEMRKRPDELERRLRSFLDKTAAGKVFGNWDDGGRLA